MDRLVGGPLAVRADMGWTRVSETITTFGKTHKDPTSYLFFQPIPVRGIGATRAHYVQWLEHDLLYSSVPTTSYTCSPIAFYHERLRIYT
jgi:hypothetical protein